jgi:hypothetical protein
MKLVIRRVVGRRTFFYIAATVFDSFGYEKDGASWVHDPAFATHFNEKDRVAVECVARIADGTVENFEPEP